MHTTTKNNKKVKQYVDQNAVEAFRDIGRGVTSSVKNDVVAGSIDTMWKQFLGAEPEGRARLLDRRGGELIPGEELNLNEINQLPIHKPEAPEIDRYIPAIDYHREVRTIEVKVIQENEVQLQQRIAQILFELKKLVKSSQELKTEFKQVPVETPPRKAGKYYIGFFEWLFTTIRNARLRVDESRSWLSVLYQKRARRQYWSMFKKHGTTFGLSGERVVATQTG